MKKLIALCLVLILAAPALTTNAESSLQKELNKELVKQLKKNYKKKKKELEKDRWKIYGSSKTLEVALLEHYTKLYNDGEVAEEIIGTADNFKSNNVGRRQAVTNAQVAYAQRAGAQVRLASWRTSRQTLPTSTLNSSISMPPTRLRCRKKSALSSKRVSPSCARTQKARNATHTTCRFSSSSARTLPHAPVFAPTKTR